MQLHSVVGLFALVVFAQAQTDDLKALMTKLQEECIKETEAEVEAVAKLNQGKYTGDGSDLKCYSKCFFLKAGFMTDVGELITAAMKTMLEKVGHEDVFDEILVKCKKTGTDPCETSMHMYNCFFEKVSEHGLSDHFQ